MQIRNPSSHLYAAFQFNNERNSLNKLKSKWDLCCEITVAVLSVFREIPSNTRITSTPCRNFVSNLPKRWAFTQRKATRTTATAAVAAGANIPDVFRERRDAGVGYFQCIYLRNLKQRETRSADGCGWRGGGRGGTGRGWGSIPNQCRFAKLNSL
ncbi:hypothetical protein GWI33_007543 [Rhynchophorus ferrugineus]|uniref:Uncharacterized protein n=1 Tax=Rhynchophorus ferrugineus TaxID=354439 RepID=A0A834IE54_RHYFE|nr:hypothetical protein GWI33_007543 [Rhynchophorus ferrugineus]